MKTLIFALLLMVFLNGCTVRVVKLDNYRHINDKYQDTVIRNQVKEKTVTKNKYAVKNDIRYKKVSYEQKNYTHMQQKHAKELARTKISYKEQLQDKRVVQQNLTYKDEKRIQNKKGQKSEPKKSDIGDKKHKNELVKTKTSYKEHLKDKMRTDTE